MVSLTNENAGLVKVCVSRIVIKSNFQALASDVNLQGFGTITPSW